MAATRDRRNRIRARIQEALRLAAMDLESSSERPHVGDEWSFTVEGSHVFVWIEHVDKTEVALVGSVGVLPWRKVSLKANMPLRNDRGSGTPSD
jgi:hypothetical protein